MHSRVHMYKAARVCISIPLFRRALHAARAARASPAALLAAEARACLNKGAIQSYRYSLGISVGIPSASRMC